MSSPAPIVWHFAGCEVHEYPEQGESGYLVTIFPDGAECPATRDHTMESVDYARHLGYATVRDALREHELLHTAFAEWMGFLYSPTLYAVAHGHAPGTAAYEEMLWEESCVLDLQRYMQTGEVGPALNPYRMLAQQWAAEFRRRFCGSGLTRAA